MKSDELVHFDCYGVFTLNESELRTVAAAGSVEPIGSPGNALCIDLACPPINGGTCDPINGSPVCTPSQLLCLNMICA